MNAKERRQYEMLLRVREFGDTYRDVFPSSTVARELFAAVGGAVEELAATDVMKLSASVSARADRKAAARERLIALLSTVNRLGKVLRAGGQTTPPFEFPQSRSDQTLLTAARQFARDAATLEADFSGHGMAPTHILELATLFDDAIRDCSVSRSDHTAARARIQELLSTVLLNVRRLDLIVDNELGRDNVIQAVWKQARRIPRRGTRVASASEPLAPSIAAEIVAFPTATAV